MNNPRRCLITGGSGYLGSELANHLRRADWVVVATSRSPRGREVIAFTLGEAIPSENLRGFDALVHCAYDFSEEGRGEIHRRNVEGTRLLLDQARAAGIAKVVTISSISAFEGCASVYGKAKLEIERATLERGGVVLRPGLIHGGAGRGMFGRLRDQSAKGLVPLLVGNPCTQFLVHVGDLAQVVQGWIEGRWKNEGVPWTVANPEPWPLRRLLRAMAAAEMRRVLFLPVPWRMAWLAVRCAERLGIRTSFTSDSVVSIVNQNPHPDFRPVLGSGVVMRPAFAR